MLKVSRPGDFQETSFARLLWNFFENQATGILEVRREEILKKIYFHQGEPVFAESNQIYEALTRLLVQKNLLTEKQAHEILFQSIEKNKTIAQAIIEAKLIPPSALEKELRKNIASKILDCFLWKHGTFRFIEDPRFLGQMPLYPLDPIRLIFRGIDWSFDVAKLKEDGTISEEKTYQCKDSPSHHPDEIGISGLELEIYEALCDPHKPEEISNKLTLPIKTVLQTLYAFQIFGFIEEYKTEAFPSAPKEESPTSSPENLDEHERENEVKQLFVKLEKLNYFEILGAAESANSKEIEDLFLSFVKRFGPHLFTDPRFHSVREKAKKIFLKGVLAYATLSRETTKTAYLNKLKMEKQLYAKFDPLRS